MADARCHPVAEPAPDPGTGVPSTALTCDCDDAARHTSRCARSPPSVIDGERELAPRSSKSPAAARILGGRRHVLNHRGPDIAPGLVLLTVPSGTGARRWVCRRRPRFWKWLSLDHLHRGSDACSPVLLGESARTHSRRISRNPWSRRLATATWRRGHRLGSGRTRGPRAADLRRRLLRPVRVDPQLGRAGRPYSANPPRLPTGVHSAELSIENRRAWDLTESSRRPSSDRSTTHARDQPREHAPHRRPMSTARNTRRVGLGVIETVGSSDSTLSDRTSHAVSSERMVQTRAVHDRAISRRWVPDVPGALKSIVSTSNPRHRCVSPDSSPFDRRQSTQTSRKRSTSEHRHGSRGPDCRAPVAMPWPPFTR